MQTQSRDEKSAQLSGSRRFRIEKNADSTYQIDLRRGEEIVLAPSGTKPDLTVAPVAAQVDKLNYFGVARVTTGDKVKAGQ